jgi:GNAT superfamily N-acetyltransferase
MPSVLEPSWVGRRVSVRRVLERRPDGQLHLGDVVGDLVTLDDLTALVETRNGPVEVPLPLVSIARLVPPSAAEELALDDVVARGWRAAETAELGGWLLRASDGFTGRANSVLPLRPPGLPLDDALAAARAWYAERGLPLRLQVATESRRLLDAGLAERGWPGSDDVHVMTARLDVLQSGPGPAGPTVEVADQPDEAWLRRYRDGTGASPAARALLVRHDHVAFVTVRDDHGNAAAIGRGTIDDEWLGVTAVEVDPQRRRTGLAGTVMRALWAWGAAGGARRSHLEVSAANLPAVRLYEQLDYRTHHDYRYRTDPSTDSS